MKAIRHLLLAVLFVAAASFARAQGEAPYTEGSVWDVTMVKTKTGLSDDYLKQIKSTFVGEMEAAKTEGLILSYKILLGTAATPQDYDILLMVEFKDFAAFDGQRAKFDALDKKIMGGADQQRDIAVKRLNIREIMGDKIMQEVTLK